MLICVGWEPGTPKGYASRAFETSVCPDQSVTRRGTKSSFRRPALPIAGWKVKTLSEDGFPIENGDTPAIAMLVYQRV